MEFLKCPGNGILSIVENFFSLDFHTCVQIWRNWTITVAGSTLCCS